MVNEVLNYSGSKTSSPNLNRMIDVCLVLLYQDGDCLDIASGSGSEHGRYPLDTDAEVKQQTRCKLWTKHIHSLPPWNFSINGIVVHICPDTHRVRMPHLLPLPPFPPSTLTQVNQTRPIASIMASRHTGGRYSTARLSKSLGSIRSRTVSRRAYE